MMTSCIYFLLGVSDKSRNKGVKQFTELLS
jgi:hypothetical protein